MIIKTAKKIATGATLLTLIIISYYFYLIYNNNLETKKAQAEEIQIALDKSISWVLQNRDTLIHENNPVLWWFLDESARLIKNDELARLVSKYRHTSLDRNTIWSGYFIKTPVFVYYPGSLDGMEQYQKFFVYGLSCNTDLGEEAFIQKQLDINFCNWRPYYSSCSTHQLMGIRLLELKKCGETRRYKQLSDDLSKNIEQLLTWDPRVGDVYIQRVLMLVESGHSDMVKPAWIKNVIDAQLKDGAWASFHKILTISGGRYLGFSYKFLDIRTPKSNFHTTAQAIYLLSLSTTGIK